VKDRFASEASLIEELFRPLAAQARATALDLRDDAARLDCEPGCERAISTDAIVAGLHLPADADPSDIAYKAVAVNASDVIAKGARPAHYLVSLMAARRFEADWLRGFADGLAAAQADFGCHLIGGDTDRLPTDAQPAFAVSVTMIGEAAAGTFVRRTSAGPADVVCVTGAIGDAALGLQIELEAPAVAGWSLGGQDREALLGAYRRPFPNPAAAPVIARHGTAAMDVSDGLVLDLSRMCAHASQFGAGNMTGTLSATLKARDIPLSEPARRLVAEGLVDLADLLTGGEDYVCLVTVPPSGVEQFVADCRSAGIEAAAIGKLENGPARVDVIGQDGVSLPLPGCGGWDHLSR